MRILIFHGYLLGGTGSNVYNARLAEALVRLGYEVHLLSQDRHPDDHAFVDAYGDWDDGELCVRPSRAGSDRPVRCTVYRPNIGGLLPVYVEDRYEQIEARTFAACSDEEISGYIEANVAAVRELVARARPQLALANHLVMGPVILARALRGQVPYVVKVHGSALEYTVKPHPERFLAPAREGLAGARAILVGSLHTATSLWDALGEEDLPERTRLGPPGVDVERFAPRPRCAAAAGVRALAARLRSSPQAGPQAGPSAFARDERAAAAALERLDPERDLLVAFVGKLIVSKGVDLLLAAWPLVLEQVPRARLVVVGFGAYRDALQRLIDALAVGDMVQVREIATAGRALEALGQASTSDGAREADAQAHVPLRHLLAFLDGLAASARERYLAAARELGERVVLTGRLDHEELAELLPACEALVVPSTFPEAFGMVAAEAAACGALPVSAAHSGLAEVSDALAGAVPEVAAGWLSFPIDDFAVTALAERLIGWLQAHPAVRRDTRDGLVATARERWSWDGVARGVITAARGELDGLARP
ncbi:MAG TPA: glycosyltransferase [Solirubrobacteraceae bacterium]